MSKTIAGIVIPDSQMARAATEMGANAILAVRYDATEIMPGTTEVLAYGTAVVVEPIS